MCKVWGLDLHSSCYPLPPASSGIWLLHHHLVKKIFFIHWIAFVSLSKISWTYLCGFMSGFLFCSIDLYVYFYATLHTLDICNYIMILEIRYNDSSQFIIFSNSVLTIIGPMLSKYIFKRLALNLQKILMGFWWELS